MTENNTSEYIDILPQIVDSFNITWHSGIRTEPINVTKKMKTFYGSKGIGLCINIKKQKRKELKEILMFSNWVIKYTYLILEHLFKENIILNGVLKFLRLKRGL